LFIFEERDIETEISRATIKFVLAPHYIFSFCCFGKIPKESFFGAVSVPWASCAHAPQTTQIAIEA
jgi:hypothetical protein